jgi:hypothetical protein
MKATSEPGGPSAFLTRTPTFHSLRHPGDMRALGRGGC